MKIFEVLEAGKELANPAGWKNKQVTANLVLLVLGGLLVVLRLFGIDLSIDDDTLKEIALIIAAVLGLINPYLILATSKKVGLSKE
jgi:hypothetical protein